MRNGIACLMLAMTPGWLLAQNLPETTRLHVTANPPPVPALKISLLPEVADLKPGNAALLYYRAFSPEWWGSIQRQPGQQFWEKLEEAQRAPLNKVKKNDLYLPTGMLKELDRAARREHCDWEFTRRVEEEGLAMLLPDVQSFRSFASFLAVRTRLALADGDVDQAIYTLQTGFQTAKHVGEGPTYIHLLVGAAGGAIMSHQLEELMQHPKAPNLYWALARLPRPFIDLRLPLGGERLLIDSELAGIKAMEKGPVPLSLAQKMLDELIAKAPLWDSEKTVKADVMKQVLSLYPRAKVFLIERGYAAADVEKMPAIQVVLLHSKAEMERWRDQHEKWMALPFSEGREGLKLAEIALDSARERQEALTMLLDLPRSAMKIYMAHMRIDRKLAAMRCIEAIKLHVLDTGTLPASLDEIKAVPVPLDPVNNKPFEYQLQKETAVLTAPLYDLGNRQGWRYEITIRK